MNSENKQKSYRTLVISDIHHRHVRAQSIIESVPHDRVVLLGDYFDSHGDVNNVQSAVATAMWLRDYVVPNPKIVPLIGNHCTQYLWQNNINFRCSGYSDLKNMAINGVLEPKHKTKFKVFHIEQGFVFSHAGLTNKLWKEYSAKFNSDGFKDKLSFFEHVLSTTVEEAIIAANRGKEHQLFAAGWDRNGFARYGGINWVDWNNLSPINGINQFVGHSIGRLPRVMVQKAGGGYKKNDILEHYDRLKIIDELNEKHDVKNEEKVLSTSYCLDTCNNHYAVIEDGKVHFYDWQNNINLRELDKYFIPESPLNILT